MDMKEIKLEDIFKSAVEEQEKERHKPRGGVIMPVEQTQIQHLWQTIRLLQKRIENLETKIQ